MPIQIEQVANRLIALLENARQLAVTHQDRTVAVDVLEGCRVYASSIRMPVDDYLADLAEAVKGKNPFELNQYFDRVSQRIISLSLIQ